MDRSQITRISRYAGTGGVGLILNITLLMVMTELFEINEIPAALISAFITLIITYNLTNKLVFRTDSSRFRRHRDRIPRYYMIMALGKAANFVVYILLLGLEFWYPIAWVVGSMLAFIGTYTLNSFIWRK
jgi:putative flippase GtrA